MVKENECKYECANESMHQDTLNQEASGWLWMSLDPWMKWGMKPNEHLVNMVCAKPQRSRHDHAWSNASR